MPYDESGRWSWDGLKAQTMDGQKAAEHIAYRQGCWWVEEALVRNVDGRIIGKMFAKTLISDAQVPVALAHVTLSTEDDRADTL